MPDTAVVRLTDVTLRRDDTTILEGVDWTVRPGEHWIVLGRNGSGKTSLARIVALYDHPSSGTVDVLGERLGRADVRRLRTRIGFVSAAFADLVRPGLTATEVVMTARYAALEPWWHDYDDADRERAVELLDAMGVGAQARRPFGTLSSGERQRVLLARAQFGDPAILVADEPNAGLDLGGREELVAQFDRLATSPGAAPIVLVTHHVEEIPARFTHLLALAGGRVLASGPIDEVLDADLLSDCFGVDLEVGRTGGRWWARARG